MLFSIVLKLCFTILNGVNVLLFLFIIAILFHFKNLVIIICCFVHFISYLNRLYFDNYY